jgi:hypothetical protein
VEHDKGWYAHEITLITHPIGGYRRRLTLPCRWLNMCGTGTRKGLGRPFFQISTSHTDGLMTEKWHILTFLDGSGNQHQYVVSDVEETKPNVIRLAQVG